MSIKTITVYGITPDGNGHENIEVIDAKTPKGIPFVWAKNEKELVRYAHNRAAEWLNEFYPGLWCYRYGKLKSDVTVETPGVFIGHHLLKTESGGYVRDAQTGNPVENPDDLYIDGVIDMSLIADDGFTGQFQWKRAGGLVPAGVSIYDPQAEKRAARRAEEERLHQQALSAEMQTKVDALPPLNFIDGGAEMWQSWLDANTDEYGHAVMVYADRWGRLMQAALPVDFGEVMSRETNEYFLWGVRIAFGDAAERTSHEADLGIGITGFMYGAAVSMLAQAWVYGEELRRWHNKQYGVSEEVKGTVNPAVLVLGDNHNPDFVPIANTPDNPETDALEIDHDLEMRRGANR